MKKNLTLLIGGIQGEGVVSLGTNLMKTLSNLGYYTYGNRNFSSRIKGGNTTMTISIGVEKQLYSEDRLDIILALDKETIDLFNRKLKPNGLILFDSILSSKDLSYKKDSLIPLPITEIAKGLSAPIIKNTCALGFLGRLMGLNENELSQALKEKYHTKGDEIVEKNLKALKEAYNYDGDIFNKEDYFLSIPEKKSSKAVMMGNEAIGFGALMAGCRFIPSYPITPASEVMEYMGKVLPRYGGAMVQVEDEIAAITMAVGASYGGVRSMTATSGPGISLMMEGIGLAGITETPVVIADIQRGGPSTGLPTKHEQSDLFAIYYGGHGEYSNIILSPSTVEDCFYDTIRAFNLADKYQCPVFILSDLSLGLSPQTIDDLDYNQVVIDRGKVVIKDELSNIERGTFKRYRLTEDGISPRSFPGMLNGGHHVTGIEHNELGLPLEKPENRKNMMEKRLSKTAPLENEESIDIYRTNNSNNTLFLTFGSVFGAIKEAAYLSDKKIDFGAIRMIRPLPKKQLTSLLENYDKIVIVENNYRKQLASIIKEELGYHNKIHSITKYDGTNFTINELVEKIGEWA
ncbi:2-oxoacid:acceptor oxidoreductase subunit alpha [Alkaliphilus sp. MSJ-5]|uniref:2-oxoacid:acceptor oxidoreductase subunit alpha n=1 Tax=Alkaliphilus flagellatus TaxID=2841507 RepID=A0ABS6G3U8_9FIRM|nr:2-oxoacid:acceptor oxidoreductase subunit alpha [Alkaliphilus flagellatus]MBU5677167.1 2-oxoacid:acceptor oxidoreductase subunit alpha [Alkaliphilus flagellatus]